MIILYWRRSSFSLNEDGKNNIELVLAFIRTELHPMGIYIKWFQSKALPSGKRKQSSQKFIMQT